MKNNYIIIGDSISYGIGGYKSLGWVSMFKQKLLNKEGTKESTNYVHSAAFPGATSQDIKSKINSIVETFYNENAMNIFIISVGVNDTQNYMGDNKVSIDEFINNMRYIISTIKEKDNQRLIILGLTGIQEKNSSFLWKPNKYYQQSTIIEYDNTLKELCINEFVTYVPLINTLEESDYIDGLHPNDTGYKKLLNDILMVLKYE